MGGARFEHEVLLQLAVTLMQYELAAMPVLYRKQRGKLGMCALVQVRQQRVLPQLHLDEVALRVVHQQGSHVVRSAQIASSANSS